jgi:hypothetical protein
MSREIMKKNAFSRRTVLSGLAAGAIASAMQTRIHAAASDGSGQERRARALQVRFDAARLANPSLATSHPDNGDESRFANRIGSYSKGLPHDARGEVDPMAYASLLHALGTGEPGDFENIVLGEGRALVNPQAGLAFDLQGADSHALAMKPPPAFASAQQAAEIAENYWMALARDVPFAHYNEHPASQQAAADLTRMQGFPGARQSGRVAIATLFRGLTPGDLTGPYLSQFLWQDTPFGAEQVDRRMRTALPGLDYVTTYPEWLALQNGRPSTSDLLLDGSPRYIRNGRDLGAWVRHDVIFQAYFNAMLIMFDQKVGSGASNPYGGSQTQAGFVTFGEPHVASALCAVATRALKAAWFQKWFVHRRLRPEAFAGRIHNHVTRAAAYPIHAEVLSSPVLSEVFSRTGSYLLPMAYPEGAAAAPVVRRRTRHGRGGLRHDP